MNWLRKLFGIKPIYKVKAWSGNDSLPYINWQLNRILDIYISGLVYWPVSAIVAEEINKIGNISKTELDYWNNHNKDKQPMETKNG